MPSSFVDPKEEQRGMLIKNMAGPNAGSIYFAIDSMKQQPNYLNWTDDYKWGYLGQQIGTAADTFRKAGYSIDDVYSGLEPMETIIEKPKQTKSYLSYFKK